MKHHIPEAHSEISILISRKTAEFGGLPEHPASVRAASGRFTKRWPRLCSISRSIYLCTIYIMVPDIAILQKCQRTEVDQKPCTQNTWWYRSVLYKITWMIIDSYLQRADDSKGMVWYEWVFYAGRMCLNVIIKSLIIHYQSPTCHQPNRKYTACVSIHKRVTLKWLFIF